MAELELPARLNPTLTRRRVLGLTVATLFLAGCGYETVDSSTVQYTEIYPDDFLNPNKQKAYYDNQTLLTLNFYNRSLVPPTEGALPEIDYTYPIIGPGPSTQEAKMSGGYRYTLQNPKDPETAKIIWCITPPGTQAFILLTEYIQGKPIGRPYALQGSEVKVTKLVKQNNTEIPTPPLPTFLCTEILAI